MTQPKLPSNKPMVANNHNTRSIKEAMAQNQKPETDGKYDAILKGILESLSALKVDVATVKNQLGDIRSTIKSIVAEEISAKVQNWNDKTDNFEKRIAELELCEEYRRKDMIKNNIIISGSDFEPNDVHTSIPSLLSEKLNVNARVLDVSIIKTAKGHLTQVKLCDSESKRLVMENKNKLKGSSIYIYRTIVLKENVRYID